MFSKTKIQWNDQFQHYSNAIDENPIWLRFYTANTIITGGHRTRVAAVTLDNMAERVSAQREDLP